MHVFLLLFYSLTGVMVCEQKLDLHTIRQDFKQAHKDEKLCKLHHQNLSVKAATITERGYYAAYHMFLARHTGNPIKKLNYFNEGKKLLEKQINLDPTDIELRFIRLCIQFYIPNYLGYKSNISEDKDFLRQNLYKMQDTTAKRIVYQYLKGMNIYNNEELALLSR